MAQIVNILKIALRILEVGWDIANDPEIEADIETVQTDIQKLIDRIQADIDKNSILD